MKSPEISADQRVTFRLRAPVRRRSGGVGRREAAADAEGRAGRVERHERSDDAGHLHLLAHRRGATMNDPSNRQVQTSFARFQSMFMVPGPAAWFPAPDVPRGAIVRHASHSTVANDDAASTSTRRPATMRAARGRIPCCTCSTVSATMPALDGRRRCGQQHPRQPDRAGKPCRWSGLALGYGTSTGPTGGRTPEASRATTSPARGGDADRRPGV